MYAGVSKSDAWEWKRRYPTKKKKIKNINLVKELNK